MRSRQVEVIRMGVLICGMFACLLVGEDRGWANTVKETESTLEERERQYYSAAEIYPGGVRAPIGRFLLMRRGKDLCALRFTEFHRGHDAKPPTLFHSGHESFYAEYDWFYMQNEEGSFTGPKVDSGHRKVDRQPLVGLMWGRLGFQLGTTEVKCGPFYPKWSYPSMINFYEGTDSFFSGIELAPTKWKEISEVNPRDPRLIWYRYNEEQQHIFIPLEDLPGGPTP